MKLKMAKKKRLNGKKIELFFFTHGKNNLAFFESDGKVIVVLVYNLMTKDIKSVYKLENKNYD